jgi:alkylation response protein AidB-like acyl-CoA dehydrogenase
METMDQKSNSAADDIRERTRAVMPLIAASSDETEARRELPDDLFSALVEQDLFRLVLPRQFGGAELAPLDLLDFLEEAGKHDASTAWCLCQNNICALVAARMAPEAAQTVFDGPGTTVAWGPGPGEARAVDGGYVLSGRFDFASGSRHATWLGAHLPVQDGADKRLTEDGAIAIFTFLFRRRDVKVLDTWQVMGLKGTGSDSFEVSELFVPEDFCVPRFRGYPPRVPGRLYVFSQSNLYAAGFASVALGIARATLEDFIGDIRDTLPRGASATRGSNNVVQSTVGQAEARLASAWHFLRATVTDMWEIAQERDAFTREEEARLRLATTWAIGQARETVNELYVAAGALTIFESQPFERRFRDIHTLSQQIQGHAAHFETVGQILMGMEPDRSMFSF